MNILYVFCLVKFIHLQLIKYNHRCIMKNQTNYYSLKDFELSLNLSATERAEEFQKYINQMEQYGYEGYWTKSYSGIGAKMKLSQDREVISFVSNDYLGMSQRTETIQAGISALTIYGTGACAAQVIGGYLDIHE